MSLKEKIRDRKARIGVIGLGYVGLPLAVEFAKSGFDVTGFDVDASKVDGDQRRPQLHPRRQDARTSRHASRPAGCARRPTCRSCSEMDAIDICVPTPLRKTKDPDLSYVVQAVDAVEGASQAGQLVDPRVDDLSGDDGRSACSRRSRKAA